MLCSYVGEVGLWTGIWLLSVNCLRTPFFPPATWLLAGTSPLLTLLLLRNVSGVPPLEVCEIGSWNFNDIGKLTASFSF